MARSISSIMSQIERLQKEAASIQLEVVARIRKDIEKFGLTPDQLFGAAPKRSVRKAKMERVVKVAKMAKYADGDGNSWGGVGKRPAWLRQQLSQGRALEEFLVHKSGVAAIEAEAAQVKRKTRQSKPPRQTVPKEPRTKRSPKVAVAAKKRPAAKRTGAAGKNAVAPSEAA